MFKINIYIFISKLDKLEYRSLIGLHGIFGKDFLNEDFSFAAMINEPEKDQLFSSAEKGSRNMLNAQWTLHENDYFQYNSGFMTEDLWEAKLGATERDLLKCEHIDIFEWRISLVEEGFRQILQEMRATNPCD